MRLLEAVMEVNQRRVAGDRNATVVAADHADALPVAALTCIDARLNKLLPDMLGLPEEQFIWLRNAGNIITSPMSSTVRSLALACAIKGAREVIILGHTGCRVGKTTMLELLEQLGKFGVERNRLPENLVEYFGVFSSERQNVIRGVEFVRSSPLIGARIPVHGLLMDLPTGRVEWVVNGYQDAPVTAPGRAGEILDSAERSLEKLARIGNIADEELKLPNLKIGETITTAQDWLHKVEHIAAAVLPGKEAAAAPTEPAPALPPKIASAKPAANPLTTLQERMRQFSAAQASHKSPKQH